MPVEDLDARVADAAKGDRRALEEVLVTVQPIVDRYCRTRLGGQERPLVSPEDLTQDVMLSVLTALARYRLADGPFLGFVYGIAAHKVSNAFRALGRDRSAAMSDVPEVLEFPESTSGPEEQAMNASSRHRIDSLLEHLSEHQRDVLVLRTVVGLTTEEVAEALDSTSGAVRVAQHRALGRLRALLAPDLAGRGRRPGRESVPAAVTVSGR